MPPANAAAKLRIDETLMGGDYAQADRIDMADADYLKQLIYLTSGGRRIVREGTRGLQFFMIQGGGEGFLDAYYRGRDASREVISDGATTDSKGPVVMIFDNNDLLVVFDHAGTLVGSALLERPISITDPGLKNPQMWTEGTANRIYDA